MSWWNMGQMSYRSYVLLLCVFYLFLVFLFHSRLDSNQTGIVQDVQHVDRSSGHAVGGNINKGNLAAVGRRGIRQRDSVVANKHNVMLLDRDIHPVKNNVPQEKFSERTKRKKAVKHADGSFKRAKKLERETQSGSKCLGDKAPSDFVFHEVVEDLYIFSAYWDDRPNDFDNKQKGTYMRMITITRPSNKPELKCLFKSGDTYVHSAITYYEMCENHNRPFGGYILSCVVPAQLALQGPHCSVIVSAQDTPGSSGTARVHVQTISKTPNQYKFSTCVSPLFGNIEKNIFVEWVELTRILGSEHITLYDYMIGDELRNTISHYEKNGTISVVPWKLPEKAQNNMWYNGQLVSIQDCLYRNMGNTEFLSFNDLDEFMIPHVQPNWHEMMKLMHQPINCGYQFRSAFFDPSRKPDTPLAKSEHTYLSTMVRTQRTTVISRIRTKCMVQPRKIFEKGIHHISKPILAHLKVVPVDLPVGLLHHYRKCEANFGMSCHYFESDTTVHKYADQLNKNVQQTIRHMGL